jgi:hypothetical protein
VTKTRHRALIDGAITPHHVAGTGPLARTRPVTIVGRSAVQDDHALDDAVTVCHAQVRALMDQQAGGGLDEEGVAMLAKTVDALVKLTREKRRRDERAAEDLARLPDDELERLAGIASEEDA